MENYIWNSCRVVERFTFKYSEKISLFPALWRSSTSVLFQRFQRNNKEGLHSYNSINAGKLSFKYYCKNEYVFKERWTAILIRYRERCWWLGILWNFFLLVTWYITYNFEFYTYKYIDSYFFWGSSVRKLYDHKTKYLFVMPITINN